MVISKGVNKILIKNSSHQVQQDMNTVRAYSIRSNRVGQTWAIHMRNLGSA